MGAAAGSHSIGDSMTPKSSLTFPGEALKSLRTSSLARNKLGLSEISVACPRSQHWSLEGHRAAPPPEVTGQPVDSQDSLQRLRTGNTTPRALEAAGRPWGRKLEGGRSGDPAPEGGTGLLGCPPFQQVSPALCWMSPFPQQGPKGLRPGLFLRCLLPLWHNPASSCPPRCDKGRQKLG